mgnify:CR=1 FL=1
MIRAALLALALLLAAAPANAQAIRGRVVDLSNADVRDPQPVLQGLRAMRQPRTRQVPNTP